MAELSWHRDQLPDFLWIGLMLGRRSDWQAVYRPLDVLDPFIPKDRGFVDGRLTSFDLVPSEVRVEARDVIRRETPDALPSSLGHALSLFPTCPARWLYEDWLETHEPDTAVGLEVLREFISGCADKSGVRSTRLRMAAFSRRVTHGAFSHPGGDVFDLFPLYPNGLSPAKQAVVESTLRAIWMSSAGIEAEREPERLRWPQEFWERCREIAPCSIVIESEELTLQGTPNAHVDPEPLTTVSEFQSLLDALDTLGSSLREKQLSAFDAPNADHSSAVLLGFASRLFRSASDLLERPSAWAPTVVGLHLRPIVETRIVSAWLAHRDDPAIFAAYREHGLGNLKLLREHIRADLGDDLDEEAREFLEFLDYRVNFERDEWAQPVNVGSFANLPIRKMAIECDLKRLYDLAYAPQSSDNHGEWPSVRELDTVPCREPLHGGHRLGRFRASSRKLGPQGAAHALQVAEEGIVAIFLHYGVDVANEFDAVWTAFRAACYDAPDSDPAAATSETRGPQKADEGPS